MNIHKLKALSTNHNHFWNQTWEDGVTILHLLLWSLKNSTINLKNSFIKGMTQYAVFFSSVGKKNIFALKCNTKNEIPSRI